MSQNNQQKALPSHVVRRQARELEEQRILGLAPLAVDAVTGFSISPHVPTALSTAPWYRKDLSTNPNEQGSEKPMTIAHHLEGSDLSGKKDTVLQDRNEATVYERTEESTAVSTQKLLPKHTPGSCKNCGATTHKTEHCLRPKRKVGSVYTGSNEGSGFKAVAPAAGPSHTKLTFEQRKDAMTRSSAKNYQDTWDSLAKEREELDSSQGAKAGPRAEGQSLFAARTAADGLKVATQELTHMPKYLENLDDDTFYDPRTKSMRGNPNALKKSDPSAASTVFRGDNALLHTDGYFDYMDQQAKYLSGDNKAFVALEGEEEGRQRAIAQQSGALTERLLQLQRAALPPANVGTAKDTETAVAALYDALPSLPSVNPTSHTADAEEDEEGEYNPL